MIKEKTVCSSCGGWGHKPWECTTTRKRKEVGCQEMSWSRGKVGHKEEKDEVKYVAAVNKMKFEIGGEKYKQSQKIWNVGAVKKEASEVSDMDVNQGGWKTVTKKRKSDKKIEVTLDSGARARTS